MEAKLYFDALRRFWWLVLLGTMLAAATAFFYSQSLTPTYRTTSTLLVNQTQVPGSIQYNDILTSERLTNTYAELLEEQLGYRQAVIRDLGLTITEEALDANISIGTVRDTQLLRISVEDPSPELAASVANALATAFIAENATQLSNLDNLSIAVSARVPTAPAAPNVAQNTILAAILGLMIVSALALALEYFDDTLKAEDLTDQTFGLPTLGLVRRLKPSLDFASLRPHESGSDLFTQLRTNLHFAGLDRQIKTLVVTGSTPGEGKSTTAAGLAISLAQGGQRVILADTDLRRPTLHKMFKVSNSYGITGLLLSRSHDLKGALVKTPYENLLLLPSGPIPASSADLLMSTIWQQLVDKLTAVSDYVVFDTPPVLGLSDASILAGRADATILVAETGRTRRGVIREALETLARTNASVIGIVKNKIRSGRPSYYYEYKSQPEKKRRRGLFSGSHDKRSAPAQQLQASAKAQTEEEPAA